MMEMIEVIYVLGLLINQTEKEEIEYLIKRELEEILFDMEDDRIDENIKTEMKTRYKILFCLLQRVASHQVCLRYMLR